MREPANAIDWSLSESDENRIAQELSHLLTATQARSILLVDRSGHLVASRGETLVDDQAAFASLTAADFSANSQMARALGEPEFISLFHEGTKLSMFMADVAGRAILAVIFDRQTTLGMVRLRARQSIGGLVGILVDIFTRVRVGSRAGAPATGPLRDADEEIEKLFSE